MDTPETNPIPRYSDEQLAALFLQLRPLASLLLARERTSISLQTMDLMHELLLTIWGDDELEKALSDPGSMLRVLAFRMRRILVDHARRKRTQRRGGDRSQIPFDDVMGMLQYEPEQLLWIDELLGEMERAHDLAHPKRKAQVAALIVFSGYTQEDAAKTIGVSAITVRRDWKRIVSWLAARRDFSPQEGS